MSDWPSLESSPLDVHLSQQQQRRSSSQGSSHVLNADTEKPVPLQELEIDFTPHHNTLTRAGEKNFTRLEDAVAEFADNSLDATLRAQRDSNDNKFQRKISFGVGISTTNCGTISIWDNGEGMDEEGIRFFATYFYQQRDRERDNAQKAINREDGTPWLGKFGVGGKEGAFYLGAAITVVTKTKGDPRVRAFTIDEKRLKEKFRSDPGRAYRGKVYSKHPGEPTPNIHEDDSGLLQALRKSEKDHNHFTYMVLRMPYEMSSEEDRARMIRAHELCTEQTIRQLVKSLKQTYYYHLNPEMAPKKRNGIRATSSQIPDMQLSVYRGGNIATLGGVRTPKLHFPILLSSIHDDPTSCFLTKARGDPFNFSFTVKLPESDTPLRVLGRIFYYPYLHGSGESRPCSYPESQVISVDSDHEDEYQRHQEGARNGEKAVSCFWQDRLIHESSCDNLWFFPSGQAENKRQGDIGVNWRNRIKCMLFFNWDAPISNNKLKLKFNLRDTIGGDGKAITLYEPRDLKKAFLQWLKNCHQNLDQDTTFFDHIADMEANGSNGAKWGTCKFGIGKPLKKGNHVKVSVKGKGKGKKKRDVYGTIQHFETECGAGQRQYAGVGYVSILEDSLPKPLQTPHLVQMHHVKLDTCLVDNDKFTKKTKELDAHVPKSVELFDGHTAVTEDNPLTWSCTEGKKTGLKLYIKTAKGKPVCKLDPLVADGDLEVKLVGSDSDPDSLGTFSETLGKAVWESRDTYFVMKEGLDSPNIGEYMFHVQALYVPPKGSKQKEPVQLLESPDLRLVVKAGSPRKMEAVTSDFTAKACDIILLPELSLTFRDASNNICGNDELKDIVVECKEDSPELLKIQPANDDVRERLKNPDTNPLVFNAGDLQAIPTDVNEALISSEEVLQATIDLSVKVELSGTKERKFLTCDIRLILEAGEPYSLELIAGDEQKVRHAEMLEESLQVAVFDRNRNLTAPKRGKKPWMVQLFVAGRGEVQPELLGNVEAPVLTNGVATFKDLKAGWILDVIPNEGKDVSLSAKLVAIKDKEQAKELIKKKDMGRIRIMPSNKPTKVVLLRNGVPWPKTPAEARVKAGSVIKKLSIKVISQASEVVPINEGTFMSHKKGVQPSWASKKWAWRNGLGPSGDCYLSLPDIEVGEKTSSLNGDEHEYALSVKRAGDKQELAIKPFTLTVEPAAPHYWDMHSNSNSSRPRLEIDGDGSQCGDVLNDKLGIIVVRDKFGNLTRPPADSTLAPVVVVVEDDSGKAAILDTALKQSRHGENESWQFPRSFSIPDAVPGSWTLKVMSSTVTNLQPFEIGLAVVRAPPAKILVRSISLGAENWKTNQSVQAHSGVKVRDLEIKFTDFRGGRPKIGTDKIELSVVTVAGENKNSPLEGVPVTEAMVTEEGRLLIEKVITLPHNGDGTIIQLAALVKRRNKSKVKLSAEVRVALLQCNRVKELRFCMTTRKPETGEDYSPEEVDHEVAKILAGNKILEDTFIRPLTRPQLKADMALPQLVLFAETTDNIRYVPPEGSYIIGMTKKANGLTEPIDEVPYRHTRMRNCVVLEDLQGIEGLAAKTSVEVSLQYTEPRTDIKEILSQLGEDMIKSSKIQMEFVAGTAKTLQPEESSGHLFLNNLVATLSSAAKRLIDDKASFVVRDKWGNLTRCKGPIVAYIKNSKKRRASGASPPAKVCLEGADAAGTLMGNKSRDGYNWDFHKLALQAVDLPDESMEQLPSAYELVVESQGGDEQGLVWKATVTVEADAEVLRQNKELKDKLGLVQERICELKSLEDKLGQEDGALRQKVNDLPENLRKLASLQGDLIKWFHKLVKDLRSDILRFTRDKEQGKVPCGLVRRTEQGDEMRPSISIPNNIGVVIELATVEDVGLARLISWIIGPVRAESTVVRTEKEWYRGLDAGLRMCCLDQMENHNSGGMVNAKIPLDNKLLPDISKETGFKGFAINLLEFDESLEDELRSTLFWHILGRTCIFENVANCRDFKAKYKGNKSMQFDLIALDKGRRLESSGFASYKQTDCCDSDTTIGSVFRQLDKAAQAEAKLAELKELENAVKCYAEAKTALEAFRNMHSDHDFKAEV
ncbi:unnamed protein product [Chrysoparadoxa australica]